MKVTTNINAVNTNFSAAKNKGLNQIAPKGKFNISGSDNSKTDQPNAPKNIDKTEGLSAENAKLVRGLSSLSSLSKEEKAEAIYGAYMGMQNCLRSELDGLETKRSCFSYLKEQKAYYTDLMENCGTISEERGKYDFFGKTKGDVVGTEEIESALNKVQGYINNYLPDKWQNKPDDVYLAFSDLNHRLFKENAAVFSDLTGITDEALTVNDESLLRIKSGLTEKNYLDRIDSDINSIKDRLKQITDIMVDYVHGDKLVKEKMDDSSKPVNESDKNPHLIKVLEEYRKALGIGRQFTLSNEWEEE